MSFIKSNDEGIKRTHFIPSLLYLHGDTVPFAQFKNREKQLWWSVTFSKVQATKSNTPPRVFFYIF